MSRWRWWMMIKCIYNDDNGDGDDDGDGDADTAADGDAPHLVAGVRGVAEYVRNDEFARVPLRAVAWGRGVLNTEQKTQLQVPERSLNFNESFKTVHCFLSNSPLFCSTLGLLFCCDF